MSSAACSLPPSPAPVDAAAHRRGRTLRLGGFLLAAAVFKLVYLVQYARLPFLRAPIFDSVVYLRQARAVLDGRFDDAALLAFSPLYGYFLALLGAGRLIGAPIFAQLALGLFNLYLIHRFVRPRFGECAALISASLYLGYGLVLSYESKLVSETLALTLALLAIGAYQGAAGADSRLRRSMLAGVLIGLSVLARASLIFVPPIAVALALLPWVAGEARRVRLLRAAGVALGLALVLGGNGLWNLRHAGFFVPVIMVSDTVAKTTSADFGDDFSAFAKGVQNPTGVPNAFDVVDQAERRIAARRDGAPDPAAARRGLGVDLVGLIKNVPVKLAHTFTDYEVSYDYGYFGERSEVPALALLPVSFGSLLVLGALGALMLLLRSGLPAGLLALVPYLPYALGSVATTTVFHASSRYRLFLILPLILLAGQGVVALWQMSGWRRAALLVPVVLACGLFVSRTLGYQMLSPATWELRVAQAAVIAGDTTELSRRISRARALSPGNPDVEARVRLLTGGRQP